MARESTQIKLPDTFKHWALSWQPATVAIFNPTKYNLYFQIGSVSRPSANAFSDIIPALSSYVADPAGASDFALFVDLAGDPFPFFPLPIVVTFSTGAASASAALASAYAGASSTINGQYDAKVNLIQSGFHIDYWRLNDLSGSIALDMVDQSRNGSYIGPTINAGLWTPGGASDPCVSFDGVDDRCDIYTVSLAGVFNGNAGTFAAWFRLLDPAVWADATNRTLFEIGVDVTNYIELFKTTVANQFSFVRLGSSTNKTVTHTFAGAPTTWQHIAFTWDSAAGGTGEVKAYVNGVQTGATQTAIGSFSGTINASTVNIGKGALGGNTWWKGMIARTSLWTKALTATEVGQLSAVP